MKWLVKFVQTRNILFPAPHISSTTTHLGMIRSYIDFTQFFEQIKLSVLKKFPMFFILSDFINIKIHKTKFETKVCS